MIENILYLLSYENKYREARFKRGDEIGIKFFKTIPM